MSTAASPAYPVPDSSYPILATAEWRKLSTRKRLVGPVNSGSWSAEEHRRFVDGVRLFPNGPWRLVADYIGTRNVRQVQTHHQKIIEKMRRHRRGLIKKRKPLSPNEYPMAGSPPSSPGSSSSDEDERSLQMVQPVDFSELINVTTPPCEYGSDSLPEFSLTAECSAKDISTLLELLCDDLIVV